MVVSVKKPARPRGEPPCGAQVDDDPGTLFSGSAQSTLEQAHDQVEVVIIGIDFDDANLAESIEYSTGSTFWRCC